MGKDEIIVGVLKKTEWKAYRDMWLKALKEAPEAFASTFEDQEKISDEEWRERLNAVISEQDGIVIFAIVNEKPIGMIGCYFEDNPKFSHIATIWGAYVEPDYRKIGVATLLANELIKRLQDIERIIKIKTYSITNAHLAVNVYKNFGFEIVGISKKELKIKDRYFDVYIMEKFIR